MKTAFVFPGQGSQSLGMLNDIAAEYPLVQQTFGTASKVLGYDLWELTQVGPAERLDTTEFTQPALLAASYALWQILLSEGVKKPDVLAGHSLGEYSALVCAGVFSFEDGIRLVAKRGQYMQAAQPAGVGCLAAIVGLKDEEVEQICVEAVLANEVLSPANYNCPGQVVIAGHTASVLAAIELAKAKGARLAKQLAVSVASHCLLMQSAAAELQTFLNSLSMHVPHIPVLSNVSINPYQDAAAVRDGLIQQLFSPVRWVGDMQWAESHGVKRYIEVGPGKVLAGLNKRILSDAELLTTQDLASLRHVLTELVTN